MQKELDIFTQGLFTTQLRGKDSTGVFSITAEGNVELLKSSNPAEEFIKTIEYTSFLEEALFDSRILVGHDRAATKGKCSEQNAHPFIVGNTVLVHNGTLNTHTHLANTETDSEAICHELDTNPNTKTVLEDLNGAFALIWYNAKTKEFMVTRNEKRPLWILETNDFDVIGSEQKLLEWLVERNIDLNKEAKYFAPHNIYKWHLDTINKGYEKVIPYEKKNLPTQTTWIATYGNKNKPEEKWNIKTVEVIPGLCYNTPFIVEAQTFTEFKNSIKITGTNKLYPEFTFEFFINSPTKEERFDYSLQTTFLVSAYGKNTQFGKTTVTCKFHYDIFQINTIQGGPIHLKKDQLCTNCKSPITKQDSGRVWARIKNTYMKTILCPDCVKHNPNLTKK